MSKTVLTAALAVKYELVLNYKSCNTLSLSVSVLFRVGVLISTVCSISRREGLLCENQHALIAVDKRRLSGFFFLRSVILQLKPLSVHSALLCAQSFPSGSLPLDL